MSIRFRELVRHFLMRFYDNDLLSPERDQLPGLASALGLLVAPGIVIPLWLLVKYSGLDDLTISERDIMSMGEKYLFVALSLTAVGFVTVLEWDALFPDRRDYLVLCPLPLSLRTIFGAKICALGIGAACVWAAVTSLTPVLFPAVVLGSAPLTAIIPFSACHLAAVTAACLFSFLSVIGLQGLFMNLLPYRVFRRISPGLQLLCLVGLLLQFLISTRTFPLLNYEQARNDWSVYASPSLWFLGLYQYGLGWDKPVFRDLARIGLLALAAASVLAFCSYALAYQRHVKRCLEAGGNEAGGPGRLRRMFCLISEAGSGRRPRERAVFQFIVMTVRRSRKQRLYVSAYAGLALAAAFELLAAALATGNNAWLYRPNRLLVSIPLVLLFVLLPGLRHAYAIPAELEANWLFRLAEPNDREHILRGVRRATLVLGVLPIYIGLLPVYVWFWGPLNALLHTASGISMALIAQEVLLFRFQKIPFTCSYVPGRSDVKVCWALYAFLFGALIHTLGSLEMWVLARPWRIVCPLAALIVIRLGTRFVRRGTKPLLFDDQPDPVVRELGLAV